MDIVRVKLWDDIFNEAQTYEYDPHYNRWYFPKYDLWFTSHMDQMCGKCFVECEILEIKEIYSETLFVVDGEYFHYSWVEFIETPLTEVLYGKNN